VQEEKKQQDEEKTGDDSNNGSTEITSSTFIQVDLKKTSSNGSTSQKRIIYRLPGYYKSSSKSNTKSADLPVETPKKENPKVNDKKRKRCGEEEEDKEKQAKVEIELKETESKRQKVQAEKLEEAAAEKLRMVDPEPSGDDLLMYILE